MKQQTLDMLPKDELTIWLPSPDKIVLMDKASLSEKDLQALKIFERITAQTSTEESINIIDEAIASLGGIELPQISTEDLRSGNRSNIAEYDQYFGVARLEASDPAYWLLSLFHTYRNVLLILAIDRNQSLSASEQEDLLCAFAEMARF